MHIITFILQGKSQHLPVTTAYAPRKRGRGKEEQKTYLLARCRAWPSQSPLAELRLAPGPAAGENQGKIPHPDESLEQKYAPWILSEIECCFISKLTLLKHEF